MLHDAPSHSASRWLPVFFGVAACSWMTFWTCHFYVLETKSPFVVGSWTFSTTDTVLALIVYGALTASNLVAISVHRVRFLTALIDGIGHLVFGVIHLIRVARPFRFEVFGYPWSLRSSIRELTIVSLFALLCFWVAYRARIAEA